ncbi:MAG: hypothetical protein F6K37_40270 [Moorea sp. SIO4E2]|uniref:hypothetical protein n=1 Tax=Moorena sp. SIO4E2 TaxID=2607826 RepID=UPI0013B61152|nr:hypothetical protein [Moorena sp. SIO4E2]NEQ11878.1 hypothetical protein [Moorena sp. SIO4E2]
MEERRKQLFDAYIKKMFKRRKTNQRYENAQVKYWLIWLAQRMVEESQTIFLIEKMQPSWLVNRKQKRIYRLMFGLMAGLMVGLMAGLMAGLIVWLIVWLMAGLMLGLDKKATEEIKTVERLDINWKKILINWEINRLMGGRIVGLIVGLIVGSMVGLMFWLNFGLKGGLMAGLMAGLTVVLMGGLMGGLIEGLESSEIEIKTSPNQGIWKSARNAITVCLMGGLMFWLIGGLIVGLIGGLGTGLIRGLMVGLKVGLIERLIIGLIIGLMVGLKNGGQACIQHFILRLVLYSNNCIPWNYARFLDYAADRIFLQKVGGGYIFIHRMLMEHFAEMEHEN